MFGLVPLVPEGLVGFFVGLKVYFMHLLYLLKFLLKVYIVLILLLELVLSMGRHVGRRVLLG